MQGWKEGPHGQCPEMSRRLKGHGAKELSVGSHWSVSHSEVVWLTLLGAMILRETWNVNGKTLEVTGKKNHVLVWEIFLFLMRLFLTFIQIYYEQLEVFSSRRTVYIFNFQLLKGHLSTCAQPTTSLGPCSSKERAMLCSCNHMIP